MYSKQAFDARDFGNEVKIDVIGYYKVRSSPDLIYMTEKEKLERQNMNALDHHPSVCPSIADIEKIERDFTPIPVFINHEGNPIGRCKNVFISQRSIVNDARELHYTLLIPNKNLGLIMNHFFGPHYTQESPWITDYYNQLSYEDKKLTDAWYETKQINDIAAYTQLLGRSIKCSNQYTFDFVKTGNTWYTTNFQLHEISLTNSPRYPKCTAIFSTNSIGMFFFIFQFFFK